MGTVFETPVYSKIQDNKWMNYSQNDEGNDVSLHSEEWRVRYVDLDFLMVNFFPAQILCHVI